MHLQSKSGRVSIKIFLYQWPIHLDINFIYEQGGGVYDTLVIWDWDNYIAEMIDLWRYPLATKQICIFCSRNRWFNQNYFSFQDIRKCANISDETWSEEDEEAEEIAANTSTRYGPLPVSTELPIKANGDTILCKSAIGSLLRQNENLQRQNYSKA